MNYTPEQLNELAKALEKFGSVNESTVKSIERLNDAASDLVKFDNLALSEKKKAKLVQEAEEKRILNVQKANAKDGDQQIKLMLQGYKSATEASVDFQNALEKTLEGIADSGQHDRIKKVSEENFKMAMAMSQVNKKLEDATKALAPFGAIIGTMLKGYRDVGNDVNLSSGILQTGLQAGATAAQTLGGGLTSVGQGIQGTGKAATIARIGLQGAGMAASLFGKGVGEVASKVVPFLTGELNKNIAAFQSLSSSGALFAGGLGDMIKTAGTGGLTLDQFSRVVKANTENFASLGEGVGEGSKRAMKALEAGGVGMRKSLLNLGFGIEEQAGLVAETMKDMRGFGGPMKASDAAVAEQTQKYAQNLRIIADITGEDAKKKMENARQQASDLAFQQKVQEQLAGLSPEEAQKKQADLIQAMAGMNEVQQKAFKESVTFGSVITPELAGVMSQSKSLGDSVAATVDAFRSNNLSGESVREIGKQYNEGIKQDLLNNKELAMAGAAGSGGIVGDMYKDMNKLFQTVNNQTPEAIRNAEEAAKAQKETTDKQTQAMTDVLIAQQAMAVKIQEAILKEDVMGKFASAMEKTTLDMLGLLGKFTGGESNLDPKKTAASVGDVVTGALEGAAFGAQIGSMIAPGVGTAVGAALGAAVGGLAAYGAFDDLGDVVSKSLAWMGDGISKLWNSLKEGWGKATDMVGSFFTSISDLVSSFKIGEKIDSLLAGGKDILNTVIENHPLYKLYKFFTETNFSEMGGNIIDSIQEKFESARAAFQTNVIDPIMKIVNFMGNLNPFKDMNIGGSVSSAVGSAKDAASSAIDAAADKLNSAAGAMGGFFSKMSPFADGGIAQGPTSGFPAMLHGREAVVPLPDGLQPEVLASLIQKGAEGGNTDLAMARPMSDMMAFNPKEAFEDLMAKLEQFNRNMETMSDYMSSVVNHTERTARGVQ